ncbi:O-antigen ligase family protein [Pseudodesulfovibrio sp. zrk46]|uniref:O-antigen ligase family protein n=1 Tax=Pseudodesulfovibrio sp. zrk46 TaxID=2725288 RepID=UPI001448D1C7|nr:O-antigen ligase family protein [Pseudodesulfovibrio sp. zrk46]QJB57402.1 O-antigen ligase family protein [Pseudodesulfovibrio sp. zrk46]
MQMDNRAVFIFLSVLFVRIAFEGPLYSLYGWGISRYLSIFFSAFVFLFSVYQQIKSDGKLFVFPIGFFVLFLFFSTLSVYGSIDYMSFLLMLLKVTTTILLYILGFNIVKSYNGSFNLLKLFSTFSIPIVVFGYYQYFTGSANLFSNYWGQSYFRMLSTFFHPNQYAYFLAILFIVVSILILKKHRVFFNFVYLGLVGGAVVLTYSRSVLFALAFAVLVWSTFHKPLRKYAILMVALVGLALGSVIVEGMDDIINKRPGQVNSVDFRVSVTKELTDTVLNERPLLGFGLGSSAEVVRTKTRWGDLPPHNDYIRILVETGLVGLFFYTIYVLRVVLAFLRDRRKLSVDMFLLTFYIVFIFQCVVMVSTNHLGNISTMGVGYFIMGVLYKTSLLDCKQKEQLNEYAT